MRQLFYFAYGSNLLKERINRRLLHEVQVDSNYRLRGYRLEFNVGGYKGIGSFANIVRTGNNNDYVEGVLYLINGSHLKELIQYEGFYNPCFFNVEDKICVTFIGTERFVSPKKSIPSLDYLNIIIEGCLDHGLHDTYNKLVDYKEANYKLRKGSKHKKIIK